MPGATAAPAKPRMSLFRKILLWLLTLMLLVLAFIGLGLFWIFAPPGTTERWGYQLKGAVGMRLELPECRSRMVERTMEPLRQHHFRAQPDCRGHTTAGQESVI